jgi:hypothetical protein
VHQTKTLLEDCPATILNLKNKNKKTIPCEGNLTNIQGETLLQIDGKTRHIDGEWTFRSPAC